MQIEDAIQGLTYHTPVTSVGGLRRRADGAAGTRLTAGVHIVVATPGRLMDHMRHGTTPTSRQLEVLVLDEADRMMDMGFWPDVQRIVSALPPRRGRRCSSRRRMPDEVLKLTRRNR